MRGVLASHFRKGVLGYIGVPIFILAWIVVTNLSLVDPLTLPPPQRVLLAALDIGWGPLALHVLATTARIVLGFALSVAIGVIVGTAMQFSRVAYALLDGLVETWRPVPPVALVPFFILIFGFSEIGHIVLVVVGTGLVIIVTTVEAMARVSPVLLQLGLVSGLSRRAIFADIVIPATLPHLRAGFRVALALAITLVVVSEYLGARYGLGYLIFTSKTTLGTPTMLLCTLLLGAIGFVFDYLLRAAFRAATNWEYTSQEAVL